MKRTAAITKNHMNIDSCGGVCNCRKCSHFYITWDPSFPRGCRLFGFKSALKPSDMVFEATGGTCQNYKEKPVNRVEQ